MEESIMSFYNAPITNQVPNGVVSIIQLHAYISTNEWLRERTSRTRVALDDEKRFKQLKQSLLPTSRPPGYSPTERRTGCFFPRVNWLSISIISPRPRRLVRGETRCSPTSGYAPTSLHQPQ